MLVSYENSEAKSRKFTVMLNIKSLPSPNFVPRARDDVLRYIVLHYTEVGKDAALDLLTTAVGGVSAHYVIDEKGEILELVHPRFCAWHAGESGWESKNAINTCSIGIELVNNGREEFAAPQIFALQQLLIQLCETYRIKPQNIIGHSDVAPSRKLDPGPYFPWGSLAKEAGLGLWCEQEIMPFHSEVFHKFGDQDASVMQLQRQLAQLGYKIEYTSCFDPAMNSVVRSFISHFMPHIILKELGLEYYHDNSSVYFWNYGCDKMLTSLLAAKKSLQ